MITAADDADLNAQGGLSAHKLIHKEGYRQAHGRLGNHSPLHSKRGWGGKPAKLLVYT